VLQNCHVHLQQESSGFPEGKVAGA
jgi:hypothetical protein